MNTTVLLNKIKKNLNKLFVFFLFFIIFQNLAFAENKKISLQLTWLHQFQFAGYYMAKEMGYYDDIGIDLEIKEYTYETKITDAVVNKEVDFAVGRSSIIIDKINGQDIVALGAIFQSNPLMLLVREDSGITSIEDFKNKKIMIANVSQYRASIIAMLNANGIATRDVELIPHSFDINDLINNKVDAMASYLSNEPLTMDDRNIEYRVFHPKDYGFDFYGDILFTTSSFIKENPKLTRKFYEASIKGWKYAFNNIIKTSEVIYQKYNTQNKSFINYVKEGEILKKMTYVPVEGEQGDLISHPSLGLLQKDKLEEIVGVYKVMGLVYKDLNTKEFIYEFNHPKMLGFHLSKQEIYFGSLFALMFLFVVFYSNKKKKWLMTKNELEEILESQRRELNKNNRLLMVQSKLAAVGEMLSNIAHQWRQPLSSITSNMSHLQIRAEIDEHISKEILFASIHSVNNQCRYLSETIDDFRSFFDNHSSNIGLFDIKDAIEKTQNLTKDSYRFNNINIITDLDNCNIVDNQNTFIQSMLNIFNNTKDAFVLKNISEEDRFFFITMNIVSNTVVIRFTDSAGGIDEDILDCVFEPYFTTKHKAKGTGLGLYMTHQIIVNHLKGIIIVSNKEFDYENKKYKGAEFTITIAYP